MFKVILVFLVGILTGCSVYRSEGFLAFEKMSLAELKVESLAEEELGYFLAQHQELVQDEHFMALFETPDQDSKTLTCFLQTAPPERVPKENMLWSKHFFEGKAYSLLVIKGVQHTDQIKVQCF